MKKAALYVRVSTTEQAQEGYSIGIQTEKLKKYAEAKDYEIVKVYTDPGHSGAKLERPALQQMITDIENKLIDIVIVFKLDRLSRSQKNTLYLIEDVFLKNNVEFISMKESFDTTTPFGRATIGILSTFAQLERDTISERTMLGRIERAKNGHFRGGNNVPLGYEYKDGELLIDDSKAYIVKDIFDSFIDGESQYSIFQRLQQDFPALVYGSHMIQRILTNTTYCGKVRFKNEVYAGKHKAIVSEKDFNIANAKIEQTSNKYKRAPAKRSSLLSRKIFCAYCNTTMPNIQHYKKDGTRGDFGYYTCNSKRKSRPRGVKKHDCSQKNIRNTWIDSIIIDTLNNLDYKAIKQQFIDKKKITNKKSNEEKLKELEKQESRLIDLYQFEKIDIELLNKKLDKINKEKEKINTPKMTVVDTKVIDMLDNLANTDLTKSSFEEQCIAVDTIINKVVMNGEHADIVYNF